MLKGGDVPVDEHQDHEEQLSHSRAVGHANEGSSGQASEQSDCWYNERASTRSHKWSHNEAHQQTHRCSNSTPNAWLHGQAHNHNEARGCAHERSHTCSHQRPCEPTDKTTREPNTDPTNDPTIKPIDKPWQSSAESSYQNYTWSRIMKAPWVDLPTVCKQASSSSLADRALPCCPWSRRPGPPHNCTQW